MSAVLRTRSAAICSRILAVSQPRCISSANQNTELEPMTHTGQRFNEDDYRRARFTGKTKLINPRFAIDMIAEDPVVVCDQRVVSSSTGGALGHPKVFINLDKPEIHSCGYSGTKFVLMKYYNEAEMGPSITYEEYLEKMKSEYGN